MWIDAFLRPRSIAVVGASQNAQTISGRPVHYLLKHGYRGRIFPINPKREMIMGLPCYPSLAALPEPVDLVMIATRADFVFDALADVAAHGAKHVIVISSGFAETGATGAALQEQMRAFCRRHGIRLLGPNAQGLINAAEPATPCFSEILERPSLLSGRLAFISQSGAFGFSTYGLAQEQGLGFRYVVSTGNEADVTWSELASAILHDPEIAGVGCYAEGVRDAGQFEDAARTALRLRKPLIVLRSGRTEVAQAAARAHTAAEAGDLAAFDRLCRQYGVIRIGDVDELFDLVRLIDASPQPRGNRVAVVSTSGGAGVMMADALANNGAQVPAPAAETVAAIAPLIPPFGSTANPIDVTATAIQDPDVLAQALGPVLADETFDALCIAVTMVAGDKAAGMAERLAQLLEPYPKPVALSYTCPYSLAPAAHRTLRETGRPMFATPIAAATALARYLAFHTRAAAGT